MSFTDQYSLNTHMNKHTGAKPHKCRHCGRCFSDPSSRGRHQKEQHGSPYKCWFPDCDAKEIRRESCFKKHLKIAHGIGTDATLTRSHSNPPQTLSGPSQSPQAIYTVTGDSLVQNQNPYVALSKRVTSSPQIGRLNVKAGFQNFRQTRVEKLAPLGPDYTQLLCSAKTSTSSSPSPEWTPTISRHTLDSLKGDRAQQRFSPEYVQWGMFPWPLATDSVAHGSWEAGNYLVA